jgi:glycine hydroxymethyltransferase
VQQLSTNNIARLEPGDWRGSFLLDRKGNLITPIYVYFPAGDELDGDVYWLVPPLNMVERVSNWLSAVSDGYVLFDEEDIWRKVEGPVLIQRGLMPGAIDKSPREWLEGVTAVLKLESNTVTVKDLLAAFPDVIDLYQPYFVGQSHFEKPANPPEKVDWVFEGEEAPDEPLKQTALHAQHQALGAKMTPFSGWDMPLRYDSIINEHLAVRNGAGLFDVSHMGMIEICGPAAVVFLDVIFSNYVARLTPGRSSYGFILDPNGKVLDDAIIYCLDVGRYWMVVNAANSDKVWRWLNAVNERRVCIDRDRPWIGVEAAVSLSNLKDTSGPVWQLFALQGPASLKILDAVLSSREETLALRHLDRQALISFNWQGSILRIARTGYTGEEQGFEIFVTAELTPQLWQAILAAGGTLGILPAGLAARDSLRTEVGLPLWGQELAGPLDITAVEAGFEGFVKYHKPFFIGRSALLAKEPNRQRTIVRFVVKAEKARRPQFGDPVLDERGRQIGQVTSCSVNSERRLQGLALVDVKYAKPKTTMIIVPLRGRPLSEMSASGNQVVLPVPAAVLKRFPVR